MLRIALIAAMAQDRVIGLNGGMPWHLPVDLAHFQRMTEDKIVLMGRKTYDSLGRPLPRRRNWVLTRNEAWSAPGVTVYHHFEDVLQAAEHEAELMVIGGEFIYQLFLPVATDLYLTEIDAAVKGDTFFPEWDAAAWQLVDEREHLADEENIYRCRFLHWQR